MLAPFKLLPRQVGSLFVAGIQSSSLSISPPVAGMQSASLSISPLVTVRWTSPHSVRKDRANQENLVQSYRICLTSVLFKSVKAGFLPSSSTMKCLTSVSSFLVASVPFTLTEYCPLPITSLHPLVSSRVVPRPPWGTWRLCKNCLWILVLGGLPPVRLSRFLRRCYKTPC